MGQVRGWHPLVLLMLLSFLCVPRYALYRYRCFPVSTHADTHSTELPYSQTWELLWVAWQVGFWHAMCFREIKSRLSERHRNLAFCLLILLELEMWGKPPRLAWEVFRLRLFPLVRGDMRPFLKFIFMSTVSAMRPCSLTGDNTKPVPVSHQDHNASVESWRDNLKN